MEDFEEYLRNRIDDSRKKMEEEYKIMGSIIADINNSRGVDNNGRIEDMDAYFLLSFHRTVCEVGTYAKLYNDFFQSQEFKPLCELSEEYSKTLERLIVKIMKHF
jgi:hypothetical protein